MANNPKNVKIIQVSKQSLPPQVAHGRWQSTGPDVPDNFVVLPLVASTPLIGCGLVHPTRWCPNTKVCLTSWNLWFTAVTIVRWGNVNQDLTGPNLAARASWCHHESVDCCTVEWSRMCVDIYILCVCVRYGWWFCPHPPKSITFVRGSPSQIWLNNVNSPATNQILYIINYKYIYILWNQHPGTKRKKTWMEDATCRSSTHSLQKAKRIYHGPKIGATNLEAGLYTNFSIVEPILGSRIWPLFWGHKTQTGASQYGQQVCYCRRKLTAAHTRDTVCVYIYI